MNFSSHMTKNSNFSFLLVYLEISVTWDRSWIFSPKKCTVLFTKTNFVEQTAELSLQLFLRHLLNRIFSPSAYYFSTFIFSLQFTFRPWWLPPQSTRSHTFSLSVESRGKISLIPVRSYFLTTRTFCYSCDRHPLLSLIRDQNSWSNPWEITCFCRKIYFSMHLYELVDFLQSAVCKLLLVTASLKCKCNDATRCIWSVHGASVR